MNMLENLKSLQPVFFGPAVSCGDSALGYSRFLGEFLIFDTTTLKIWNACATHTSVDAVCVNVAKELGAPIQVVKQWVEQVLQKWSERADASANVPLNDISAQGSAPFEAKIDLKFCVSLGGPGDVDAPVIELKFNDERVYWHFFNHTSYAHCSKAPSHTLSIIRHEQDKAYSVVSDIDETTLRFTDFIEMKSAVCTRLLTVLNLGVTPLIFVHGAVVAMEGQENDGILFYGESGSGKSTLSMLFQSDGAVILCDDICLIGTDGRAYPGPFNVSVRKKALNRLESYAPPLLANRGSENRDDAHYYEPDREEMAVLRSGIAISRVAKVRYTTGEDVTVKHCGISESLPEFLVQSVLPDASDTLSDFAKWIEQRELLDIVYSDFEALKAALAAEK